MKWDEGAINSSTSHAVHRIANSLFLARALPPAAAALMSSIYDDHRDEDGFLYIAYSGENTFGSSEEWQLAA